MRKVEFEIKLPDRENKEDVERYKWEYQVKYKRGYRRRKKYVNLAFEEEEHERLKKEAKKEGKPITSYILDLFYASERKAEVKNRVYYEAVKELNKIGVNINQIARKVNIDIMNYPINKDELKSLLVDVAGLKKMMRG